MSEKVIQLVKNINNHIVYPIIGFLFAVATIVFLWGVVEFIWKSDSPTARDQGQQHMIWGIVGILIMISVIGIIEIFLNTFGISTTPLQNVFLN